ncbi:MAG: hypothetical protein OHK0021_21730 [Bryobacter sp.]
MSLPNHARKHDFHNQLEALRKARNLSASRLAELGGVSRQTIYAIENGSYIPNTVVALRLAAALDTKVENIFQLPAPPVDRSALTTQLVSPATYPSGTPLRLVNLRGSTFAVPVRPEHYFLPDADAVLESKSRQLARAKPFEESDGLKILLAGCDPALGILAARLVKEEGVELITAPANSTMALDWLRQGKVHIAGIHLRDESSGQFNLPFLPTGSDSEPFSVYTFAQWESGFLTAPGNPWGIRDVTHLAQSGLRFVKRESGSGSQILFNRLCRQAAMPAKAISCLPHAAKGHLDVAQAIVRGEADSGLANRSAAKSFGLGFVPLQQERFDLVLSQRDEALPAIQALLAVLQRASLRKRLSGIAGYETHQTGAKLS